MLKRLIGADSAVPRQLIAPLTCTGAGTQNVPAPDACLPRLAGSFTSYDGAGRVVSREMRHKVDTDVYRSEWSYLAYDTAGRLASVTNYGPTNIVTTYAYGFDGTDGQYSQVTIPTGA